MQKRIQQKAAESKAAYAAMHDNRDWLAYNDSARADLWLERGINEASIEKWGLGFCERAPFTNPIAPSLTIPVFYGQRLYDIRHRILGGAEGQKYRSHLKGIVPVYFNLDNLGGGKQVYLVEGEIKAIRLMQEGVSPVIAYPGIQFIQYITGLVKRHGTPGQEFIAIPDPGTFTQVEKYLGTVAELGNTCSIVELIDKPDDFVDEFGAICLTDAIRMRRRI